MSLYARPSSHGKRWCVRNLFPWVRVCSAFFLREPRRCSRAQSAISPLSARPGCPIEYQDRPRPAQAKGRCLIRTPATVDKSPSRRFFGNTVPLLDRSPSCKYSDGLSSSAVSLITPRRVRDPVSGRARQFVLGALQQLRRIAAPPAVKLLCRARLMRLMAMNDAG